MENKTRVIAFANNKGGSGKTTTCSNLACGLSRQGKKVLLIDGDMQLNLSLSLLDEETVLTFAKGPDNLFHALVNETDLRSFIIPTPCKDLDIIPSSTLMSSIEYKLYAKTKRDYVLKKILEPVRRSGNYDYILIDAPPTLGGWVMNILAAVHEVIIPVEATPWGLFGLGNMFEFLEEAKKVNPGLKTGGIIITKVDTRKNYVKQTLEALKELQDVHVFEPFIRIDSAVEWSQDNNMPVILYKKSSRSAREYLALAREIDRQ